LFQSKLIVIQRRLLRAAADPWHQMRRRPFMNLIERAIEGLFFSSRWLMAPFLLGLVAALLGLLYRFGIGLASFVLQLKSAESNDSQHIKPDRSHADRQSDLDRDLLVL
jgi:hypothetical protein